MTDTFTEEKVKTAHNPSPEGSFDTERIRKVFESIAATSSKKQKEDIIRQNAGDDLFEFFLVFLYDETITTGLSTKKIDKVVASTNSDSLPVFFSAEPLMAYIKEHNTGTDDTIRIVQTYLSGLSEVDASFMKQVVTKSLKCGITASTVNKAIPGLIERFQVQLAFPYEKYAHKVTGEFTLTQKLDGHRTLVECASDGTITFRTRKGHEIHGLEDIEEELKRLLSPIPGTRICFDGEVVVSDASIPMGDVFSATSRIIRKDGVKKGLRFHVFDIRSHTTAEGDVILASYADRRKTLETLLETSNTDLVVLTSALYTGDDTNQISEWMKVAMERGWEGLMLNVNKAPYENKRSQSLLKIKEFFSSDLMCTGMAEGTGKNKGSLGAIIVDYKGYTVSVGSGFSDAERKQFWSEPDAIVGKIVEIRYFEESKNSKNDELSLRFPTFSRVRLDKNESDISYES